MTHLMSALALPDWMPWWLALAILVPALIWLLAFLASPFAVIGLKSRLEAIEARLDALEDAVASRYAMPPAVEIDDDRPPLRPPPGLSAKGLSPAAAREPPSREPPEPPAAPRGRQEPRVVWPGRGAAC